MRIVKTYQASRLHQPCLTGTELAWLARIMPDWPPCLTGTELAWLARIMPPACLARNLLGLSGLLTSQSVRANANENDSHSRPLMQMRIIRIQARWAGLFIRPCTQLGSHLSSGAGGPLRQQVFLFSVSTKKGDRQIFFYKNSPTSSGQSHRYPLMCWVGWVYSLFVYLFYFIKKKKKKKHK